ncbi:MAG: hypothetical protein M4579_000253 [Chaenotheca gracillima]|nr:MAG: hypothetical protein M4579_000253 [Chaenotheca gracillima]
MESYILRDRTADSPVDYILFFIPGNPGLISYYAPFLDSLSLLLSTSQNDNADAALLGNLETFEISGTSLAAFESGSTPALSSQSRPPYGLEQQIEMVERRLNDVVNEVDSTNGRSSSSEQGPPSKPAKVILMGHSVGAFISLEVLRRHQEAARAARRESRIGSAILLFPTITHIAKSPSGILLNSLLRVPHVPLVAGTLVRVLVFFIPTFVLYYLVRVVMRFPPHAALTTANFIKAPIGVRQALHLAEQEMEMITEDRWDEDIWGWPENSTARNPDKTSPTKGPKMLLHFGTNDHWVSDYARDEFIAMRGGKEEEDWKPQITIDQEGIPHGFCIHHSEQMARKAQHFIEQIIEHDKRTSSRARSLET